MVKVQLPVAPKLEVSFPNVVFDKKVSVFDKNGWKLNGNWNLFRAIPWNGKEMRDQSMFTDKAGDELIINFSGTGISIEGNWYKDGGKADIYVDGKFHRSIDTYYDYANQQHTESIWHLLNLQQGEHSVKLVVKGEKRPESEGTKIYITSATIFKTAPKKNDTYKFSFENQTLNINHYAP